MRDSDRPRRKWYLSAVSIAIVATVAVAIGAVPRTFNTGDTLTAADLNGNFAALEARLATVETGLTMRTIARAHGKGPNETTINGAIATRLLQYTKIQDATGIRITWTDNLRCSGIAVSCEWEVKIDGRSCTMPGPLTFDVFNDTGTANAIANIHRPQAVVATCFGISKGPHTVQVYVAAGGGGQAPGTPYTGWNGAYWSIEVEEVN